MRDWREVLAPRFALAAHKSAPSLFDWCLCYGVTVVWVMFL